MPSVFWTQLSVACYARDQPGPLDRLRVVRVGAGARWPSCPGLLFLYTETMAGSISVNKKSIGRPKKKGGVYPVIAVRLSPNVLDAVETWAHRQGDKPGRSEAIRRLVEIGLRARN
jgi:hypothetical protein